MNINTILLAGAALLALVGSASAGVRVLHNGSVMDLHDPQGGGELVVRYVDPRPGMESAGARSGDLLVSGRWHGGTLYATAYVYTRCGVIPYQVTGGYEEGNGDSLVLDGPAPIVNSRCQVVRYEWNGNSHLEFTSIN
jgi:hypothetical protein